jgi:hypothetical protein
LRKSATHVNYYVHLLLTMPKQSFSDGNLNDIDCA